MRQRPTDVAGSLKGASANLAPDEAFRQPTAVLLGVSTPAQSALDAIGIRTVFDLAASRVFATATALLAVQRDPTLAEARLNAFAADAVDAPAGVPVTELAERVAGFNPDAPADLLPKSGVYPTPRVFYRKLVLDAVTAPGRALEP